jgi:hypothetical protein
MLRFGFIGLGATGMNRVNSVAELCKGHVETAVVCSNNADHIAPAPDYGACLAATLPAVATEESIDQGRMVDL